MNENIKGTIQISYEIDPNSVVGKIDKHSIIKLTVVNNTCENSIQNIPQNILRLIYNDLYTKLHNLKPIVDILKENLIDKE